MTDADIDIDFSQLVNSVQKHVCSSSYCLRSNNRNGEMICRFDYPFQLSSKTCLEFRKIHSKEGNIKYRAEIKTVRNDPRLNRYQRVQLQGWRANCDISVVIDYTSCVEYLTKYAAKPEKISSVAKDAFTRVASSLNSNDFDSIRAIKKLMMQSVGLREMSIQEVCHQVLNLKMFSSSFEVITISLDGSRQVKIFEGKQFRSHQALIFYANREDFTSNSLILCSNLITFHSEYQIVKNTIRKRKNKVVVRTFPNYPSNPRDSNYGMFCKYNLLKYKQWRRHPSSAWNDLEECNENHINCWNEFLQTDIARHCVPNYAQELENAETNLEIVSDSETESQISNVDREDWMYVADFLKNSNDQSDSSNNGSSEYWLSQRSFFDSNLIAEMPMWINRHKQTNSLSSQFPVDFIEEGNKISSLNQKQTEAFNICSTAYVN